MGLNKIGISLFETCTKYAEACGKKSILQTIPQDLSKIDLKGLKVAPKINGDTFQLSENSYISEPFVKSLTKIKGKDSLDTLTKIKDEIMKRMGYAHPEALKMKSFTVPEGKITADGGFSFSSAEIIFPNKFLQRPIEQQIAMLYHELDHADKLIKLYKLVGKKRLEDLIVGGESKISFINQENYEQLAKGLSVQDFDSNKWSKAVNDYKGLPSLTVGNSCRYFNNPLEVSAYTLQSKIQNILGMVPITARYIALERIPSLNDYSQLVNILNNKGIKDMDKQDYIVDNVLGICIAKNVDKTFLKLLKKQISGQKVDQKELEYAGNQIDKNYTTVFAQSWYDAKEYIKKEQLIDYIFDLEAYS